MAQRPPHFLIAIAGAAPRALLRRLAVLLAIALGGSACTSTTHLRHPLTPSQAAHFNESLQGREADVQLFSSEAAIAARDLKMAATTARFVEAPTRRPREVPAEALQAVTWPRDHHRALGFLHGAGLGFALGAAGGAVSGFASGNDSAQFFRLSAAQKAGIGAIVFGGLGLIAGGVVGALIGAHERVEFTPERLPTEEPAKSHWNY